MENVKAFAGKRLKREHLGLIAAGDCDVYRPDGEPLIMLRRGAVPKALCDAAFPVLHHIGQNYKSDNRGSYAGAPRVAVQRPNGSIAKSRGVAGGAIASSIVGYFDRVGGRFPFCRATAFTAQEHERWLSLPPLAQAVAAVYAEAAPERYANQAQAVAGCKPDWIIKGTPFSTLTVNCSVLGAVHRDAGDFKGGLGCITVHRRGTYQGAILGFPEYSVGVELFDGDLLLFNAHDWHGVTEFEGELSPDHERISVVYYLRERMKNCGTMAEELARAKARSGVGLGLDAV